MKILLVEDDQFIRDIYVDELIRGGFEVDSAATGKEGLDKISKNEYDLLLLDIMLPDINGLEILKQVKQNPATKNVKTIMLTNLGQDAIIKQGFDLGADKYLVKMANNPDQIISEIKGTLGEEAKV